MKYELTNETKEFNGRKLHRIRALKDFGDVKKGDLGGWVQSKHNLSHYGNCWVFGQAKVFDEAWVFNKAKVSDQALVFDQAMVFDKTRVYDQAQVFGHARVFNQVQVFGEARVYDKARVFNKAKVYDQAQVFGEAQVFDQARVSSKIIIPVEERFHCGLWILRKILISVRTKFQGWI